MHDPATTPPRHTPPPPSERARAARTVVVGIVTFVVSALLVLSPLAFGRWGLNKYFVALGFVGAGAGAGPVVSRS